MENFEISFAISETLRHKHVENYLSDLNERLKQLRQQHNEIIEKSMSIMHEINEVTTSVDMVEVHLKNNTCGIKELINGFEMNALKNDDNNGEDDGKILQYSKELEENKVLKESLMLLQRTKGSLEKIETFLNKVVKEANAVDPMDTNNFKKLVKTQLSHPFNLNLSKSMDLAQFASCCSSATSLKALPTKNEKKSITEQMFHDVSWSFTDIGYQGDLDDSEYDLLAANKRKGEMSFE